MGSIKNYIKVKFVKKKRTFRKIFPIMQNFLGLQCLVDDLVEFLELLMMINGYLKYIVR